MVRLAGRRWAPKKRKKAPSPFALAVGDARREFIGSVAALSRLQLPSLIIFRNDFLNLSISFDAPIRMRLGDALSLSNRFPLPFTFSRCVFILIVFPSLSATPRRVCACGARTQFIHRIVLFIGPLLLRSCFALFAGFVSLLTSPSCRECV